MKTILPFLILFLVFYAELQSQISNNAIVLTLRVQQGIFLDSASARHVDSALAVAKTVSDSILFIKDIPKVDRMIVKTSAEWSNAWKSGNLLTGNTYIDSLGMYYGLASITVSNLILGPRFTLKFSHPLNLDSLAKLYSQDTSISSVYAESVFTDGSNIYYFRKEEKDHFVFYFGDGDCPSGCIFKYHWYISVERKNGNLEAMLEESRKPSGRLIFRWNIPNRYAMTMFPNLDSIFTTIKFSPEWWVRRHAIEGLWRFFEWNYPWAGSESDTLWDNLKTEILLRRNDVKAVLQTALSDSDADVKASAELAISKINTLSVGRNDVTVSEFKLLQNYPNPFNPKTTIEFQIPRDGFVSLKVFDLLGREVATLVDDFKLKGSNSAQFDGSNYSSGMYFYRLRTENYTEIKKMILTK